MNRSTSYSMKTACWLLILCGMWWKVAALGTETEVPLRYTPRDHETLEQIASRFDLPVDELRIINSGSLGGDGSVLLVRKPRSREEAVDLLEEARQAESLGGISTRKAASIYRGILEAARLAGAEKDSATDSDAIGIPSETVARALLGWGRVNEIENPEEARFAFNRVRTFFPDLEDLKKKAEKELAEMDRDNRSTLAKSPPTAIEKFPTTPLFVVDIDTRRFRREFPEISLVQGLRTIPGLTEDEAAGFLDNLDEVHDVIEKVLEQVESIHVGLWLD